MICYWILEPEVAGGLGEGTIVDRLTQPPIVSRLHYGFQGWLATGCAFDTVQVTTEYPFDELYPGRQLPPFTWLKITGRAGVDDFGLSADAHCEIEEFVG